MFDLGKSGGGQVAPQSQLEESANDRGEAGVGEGSKTSPLRRTHCSKSPLLEVFFLDIAFKIAPVEIGWILFPDTLNVVTARRSPPKRVPNQAPEFR